GGGSGGASRNSRRMGVPTIRVFPGAKKGTVAAKDTKMRFANGESTRLATPGCTFGSKIARLLPSRNAASTRGGLVYPPMLIARSGRRWRQIARHWSRPTGTAARPCTAPHMPRPITPRAVIVINSNPSLGTTFVSSPRSVPTKIASLPGSSRANSRRSEEHTSELQSPDHLVCRLLLEKKKKKQQAHKHVTKDNMSIDTTSLIQ